jgi:hypothetical protein
VPITESSIDLWLNVLQCVFVSENQVIDSLSHSSMIACKSSNIVINDQDINNYSSEDTNIKGLTFCGHEFTNLFPLFHFNCEYRCAKYH